MGKQVYPPAQAVAPKVHAHLAQGLARARQGGGEEPIASLPDEAALEAIIDAAFWASLRREEGYVPRISLAFLSPAEAWHPIVFERALSLEAHALTKVAPAVERPGIHLGVWRTADDLCVWGAARTLPKMCFVLEVAAPGLLVLKYHRGENTGKFVNLAVLEGDQIKVIDPSTSSLMDGPSFVNALLGSDAQTGWVDSVNLLVQLSASMRAHGRGGVLLLVPPASDRWRESMVQPIPYAASPPFSELALLGRDSHGDERGSSWQDAVARAVEAIAGLTAVDGATVLTAEYELLAFGAKIARRRGHGLIEQVSLTEPVMDGVATLVNPAELGGTRHLSAAQFVQDQRDALALVASQDGRFTVFAWSDSEGMVHAHRVEALLL